MVSQPHNEEFHIESGCVSLPDLICLNHDDKFSLRTVFSISYSNDTFKRLFRRSLIILNVTMTESSCYWDRAHCANL